jgi:hypothetical protein
LGFASGYYSVAIPDRKSKTPRTKRYNTGNINELWLQRYVNLPSKSAFDAADETSRKAQYEKCFKKWGFHKNKKRDVWEANVPKVVRSKRENKDSEVIISNVVVPMKKLRKELSRYGYEVAFSHGFQGTIIRALLKADKECSCFGSVSSKDTRRSTPGRIYSSTSQL